jgi:hypothetical protein
MKHLIAVSGLLWACVAVAQTPAAVPVVPACLPGVQTELWAGTPLRHGISRHGAWVQWVCYSKTPPTRTQKVVYVATVPEFSKIGGRLATIVNAQDPLASLQTLHKRVTVLPLTDPSLAAIVAEVR